MSTSKTAPWLAKRPATAIFSACRYLHAISAELSAYGPFLPAFLAWGSK